MLMLFTSGKGLLLEVVLWLEVRFSLGFWFFDPACRALAEGNYKIWVTNVDLSTRIGGTVS